MVRHGDTGVAVPADVHGGVGPMVVLFVQRAAGRVHIVLRLLLQRNLIRRPYRIVQGEDRRRNGGKKGSKKVEVKGEYMRRGVDQRKVHGEERTWGEQQ